MGRGTDEKTILYGHLVILPIGILNYAKSAVSKNTSTEMLTNFLLEVEDEQLVVTATNLEISIRYVSAATVEKKGQVLVPANLFYEAVKKLSKSDILLELDEKNNLNIQSGMSSFNIRTMVAEDFPEFPEIQSQEGNLTISAALLHDMLSGVVYAISNSDAQPGLTGVRFEVTKNHLTLVAIDGYRIAIKGSDLSEITYNETRSAFLVPGRSIKEIDRIIGNKLELKVSWDDKHLIISKGNMTVTACLLDSEFIDYKKIIPDTFSTTANVNRKSLREALERAMILAKRSTSNIVKLAINNDEIAVTSAIEEGDVEDFVPISSLDGEKIKIAFNGFFLLDALRQEFSEAVLLEMTGKNGPMVIKNETDGRNNLDLLLPIRCTDN